MLPAESGFPFQVHGMEVVSRGMNVRAFTVPQISWEPVINLTPPAPITAPPSPFNPTPPTIKDPPFGPNYYPDDGGPTRILNNSADHVALAPIPLTDFLVENFADKKNFAALSLFTLPFRHPSAGACSKQVLLSGAVSGAARISIQREDLGQVA